VIGNGYRCSAIECLECFCMSDEPVKLGDIKIEVHEEYYAEGVMKRGVESGHKILQVLVNALKFELGESGGDRAGQWRPTLAC